MTHTPTPSLVLDTNIVLAWLVFDDPSCHPLAHAIVSGQLRWVASAHLRAEFDHVLGRGPFARWNPDHAQIRAAWDRWATVVEAEPTTGPASRLRCTDADDQPFIDLALVHRCQWLVSRDRAVLKLARRALPLGLHIVPPEHAPALDGARRAAADQGSAQLPVHPR